MSTSDKGLGVAAVVMTPSAARCVGRRVRIACASGADIITYSGSRAPAAARGVAGGAQVMAWISAVSAAVR
jgi:hypothetical protein